ncbi:MAG: cbb3-type cytochrome c oxidase subunit 3 [Rhodomicrobiaceae bacterium]
MSYDDMRAFFGVTGLLIFVALFIGVLIYTFWPGNKKRFDRASRIPLEDDEDQPTSRGDNGRK